MNAYTAPISLPVDPPDDGEPCIAPHLEPGFDQASNAKCALDKLADYWRRTSRCKGFDAEVLAHYILALREIAEADLGEGGKEYDPGEWIASLCGQIEQAGVALAGVVLGSPPDWIDDLWGKDARRSVYGHAEDRLAAANQKWIDEYVPDRGDE